MRGPLSLRCTQGCNHGIAFSEGIDSGGQDCKHQGGACEAARTAVSAGEAVSICNRWTDSVTAMPDLSRFAASALSVSANIDIRASTGLMQALVSA